MVEVADGDRAAYHAAACIAANHVVALLGQVERVAASVGLDLESFLPLTRAAVDDVAALGAGAALTGPARRGDWATLSRHLDALPESERAGYQAGAALATRLAQADAAPPAQPDADRARTAGRHRAGRAGGGVGAVTVEVVETVAACRAVLDQARAAGRVVGLVPTMGALHDGHTSLLDRARAECDVVAVSIFVNPLQFGDPEDIAHYPRTLDARPGGVRRVGGRRRLRPERARDVPVVARRAVDDGVGARRQRGAGRARPGPGHFDGVATVVAKLFTIAGPCRAYFGLKDFQQLAVVRRMARELSLPVEVVGCPIVREADGLALSSRNVRLSADERQAATVLSRALAAGRAVAGRRRALGRRGRRGHARRGRRRAAGAARLRRRGRRRHPRRGRPTLIGDRGSLRLLDRRPRWARSG